MSVTLFHPPFSADSLIGLAAISTDKHATALLSPLTPSKIRVERAGSFNSCVTSSPHQSDPNKAMQKRMRRLAFDLSGRIVQ